MRILRIKGRTAARMASLSTVWVFCQLKEQHNGLLYMGALDVLTETQHVQSVQWV